MSSVSDDRGGGWADTAHTTELQPFQSPGLFCVSCAFSRLSPALPVSDPGRSFYRGVRGIRRGEREPVPRTYFCRVIAAAEVGGALTQRPIQAFSKDPDLTHFYLRPFLPVGLRVPLKVGEIWILGESLDRSLRESAAHFRGRDVPTEVGSRNRFHLPSASSAQSAVKAPPRIGNGQGRA